MSHVTEMYWKLTKYYNAGYLGVVCGVLGLSPLEPVFFLTV